MIAQLKEKFCITGKEWKGSDSGSSSKTAGQLGKPNKSSTSNYVVQNGRKLIVEGI
jgi:hypothetical protein